MDTVIVYKAGKMRVSAPNNATAIWFAVNIIPDCSAPDGTPTIELTEVDRVGDVAATAALAKSVGSIQPAALWAVISQA